jgi:hypothetical protein
VPFFVLAIADALRRALSGSGDGSGSGGGEPPVVHLDGGLLLPWAFTEEATAPLPSLPETATGVARARIDDLTPDAQVVLKAASVLQHAIPIGVPS